MSNEIDRYFNGLLTVLGDMEAEQERIRDDAQGKVLLLQKNIYKLKCIHEEILNVFADDADTNPPENDKPKTTLDIGRDSLPEELPPETGSVINKLPEPETGPSEPIVTKDDNGGITANPSEYTLLGEPYTFNGWPDVIENLCEAMILREPYKFVGISVDPEQRTLSLDEPEESHKRLSNGLYVITRGSPNEIKTRCESVLSACGYSYNNDIQFSLTEDGTWKR